MNTGNFHNSDRRVESTAPKAPGHLDTYIVYYFNSAWSVGQDEIISKGQGSSTIDAWVD